MEGTIRNPRQSGVCNWVANILLLLHIFSLFSEIEKPEVQSKILISLVSILEPYEIKNYSTSPFSRNDKLVDFQSNQKACHE